MRVSELMLADDRLELDTSVTLYRLGKKVDDGVARDYLTDHRRVSAFGVSDGVGYYVFLK